jgi:hypothetical protein
MGYMAISIIRTRTPNYNLYSTYLNSYLLGAPREYVLHGLNSDLGWASHWSSFSSVFLVCTGPPSILLFVPTDRVSHLTPSLLSGQLLTNVQVNNTAALHDTHGHTYIHQKSALLFFFSFTLLPLFLAGRLAQTLPVWHSNNYSFLKGCIQYCNQWQVGTEAPPYNKLLLSFQRSIYHCYLH